MLKRFRKRGINPLFLIVTIFVLLIITPSLFIVIRLFNPPTDTWLHIKEHVLADYIKNSIILVSSVGSITAVLGTYFSWSLSRYNWKHIKFIEALFIIPLAIPIYISGYVYAGIFNPFGSLDRILMKLDIPLIRIDILSIEGAIFVFSLCLTPYVLLVSRNFFENLPNNLEESSRLLGKSTNETFFKLILPMAKGSIIAGVVLVALEVLNDYGTVKYFGIPTFSTAIYSTWFGMSDINGAIRLAASLMSLVILILLIEQFFRNKGRLSPSKANSSYSEKKQPSLLYKIVFTSIASVYIAFALIIPLGQLLWWSLIAKQAVVLRDLGTILINTISLGIIVTVVIIVFSILLNNLNRLQSGIITKIYSRIVVLGYSIPASIIAIAVLVFVLSIDSFFAGIYMTLNLKRLFLSGSIITLIFALIVRFMAIGFNNIEAGFSKIGVSFYEASKVLGKGELETFFKIDLPMLKISIFSAAILTFVDIIKELPLTLILRPFNFDTLATKVFAYAGDEMIHEASIYSLLIILTSIFALIILSKMREVNNK